jgi:dissimilatory sulfite reductase (desulfoviridin) alpha/beta subunit
MVSTSIPTEPNISTAVRDELEIWRWYIQKKALIHIVWRFGWFDVLIVVEELEKTNKETTKKIFFIISVR